MPLTPETEKARQGTVRVLAVSDEVDEGLYTERVRQIDPALVVACGDLPWDYLEYLVTTAAVPLLYVCGNHDPEVKTRPLSQPLIPFDRATPFDQPWKKQPRGPGGCTDIHGKIVEAGGLAVAGLGGSIRYSDGPNQYSEREMRRRVRRLELRALARMLSGKGGVDLLVTHSPPSGRGDIADDPAHRGFVCFNSLVQRLAPRYQVHGHVHPYERGIKSCQLGRTTIVNVIPTRILEV